MVRAAPPAHYVRHNKASRMPRTFVYFDTEANNVSGPTGSVQTFRLAVATVDRRQNGRDPWAESDLCRFTDPFDLWSWIVGQCRARARTVCVAHNLAYDLRIADGFTHLPALGWTLGKVAISRDRAWCSWRRDGRTLVMVDSLSWVPVSLERLGELVEMPKPALPDWSDDDAAWWARCERDVQILAEVGRRLWGWVAEADLGNWKPTGAGQSWAAYRHRFMSHKLLAHDDDDARAAERRASWTGRCEVWRHGTPTGGPFTEWDMSSAYARIGATHDVPIRLAGHSTTAQIGQVDRLARNHRVLAACTVTTDVPTVPAELDGRIVWPVGTFDTVLWDTELDLARSHGADVRVSGVWWYHRAPALEAFCRWVLLHLDGRQRCLDPVVVCAAKHWSRALIGRFAARWSEWEPCGRAPEPGLGLTTVIDRTDNSRWEMLQVGTECRRATELVDAADSVVSVMSWVMAQCRVDLWRLCELAGPDEVVYMDTDSVITTAAGTAAIEAAMPEGLRRKGEWATVELLAPRQLLLSGRLRAAGVPRGSVRRSATTWAGDVWSELSTDLRAGRADRVSITERRVTLTGTDSRREHLDDGSTAPWRL